MRKHLPALLQACVCLMLASPLFAQLAPGKVMFIAFDMDTNKGFALLALDHIPEARLAGVTVRRGTVYREILAAADECGCDSVVMTAHRPEMKDYLLGPNAARVVRHATIPVLVVR